MILGPSQISVLLLTVVGVLEVKKSDKGRWFSTVKVTSVQCSISQLTTRKGSFKDSKFLSTMALLTKFHR